MGWSLPEVFVLAHAFSDKENTTAESSKNKDFCIRFISRSCLSPSSYGLLTTATRQGRPIGPLAADRLAATNWEERAEIKKAQEVRIYQNRYGVVLLNLDSAAFEEYAAD